MAVTRARFRPAKRHRRGSRLVYGRRIILARQIRTDYRRWLLAVTENLAGSPTTFGSRLSNSGQRRAFRRALITVWQRRCARGYPGYQSELALPVDRGGIARYHAVSAIPGRLDRRSARRWR